MKKENLLAAIGAGALMLGACTSELSPEDDSGEALEASPVEVNELPPEEMTLEPIVINVDDFYDALLLREDKNGKTDLSYKADLSRGAFVKFENAFFYAMSTGGLDWEAKFSTKKDGSTSIINCALLSREEKDVFVKNDMKRLMSVDGTVQYLRGDTVFLKGCKFKDS